MACLIGIDVGTTNRKVVAYDENGALLAVQKKRSRQTRIDPDEIWGDVAELTARVLSACRKRPDAVAVASIGEACFPVRGGRALAGCGAWYEGAGNVSPILELIGEGEVSAATGLDVNSIFTVPKLLCELERSPALFGEADRWLFMADWVNYKLSGEAVTNHTLAGRSLLFDVNGFIYREDWRRELGFPKPLFAEPVAAGTVVGKVTAEAAAITGLPVGLPVVMGGHDHPCGTVAAGAVDSPVLFDSSGTAEAFLMLLEAGAPLPKELAGARICPYLDGRRRVIWHSNPSGGVSLEWAMNLLSGRWDPTLLDAAEAIPPGAAGVLFLPFLNGAGAPWNDPAAGGGFWGLRSYHNNASLMRAVLEGLCCLARHIVFCTERVLNREIREIRVAGGGSRVDLWQQMKADATGIPVACAGHTDATPAGAAALAGVGLGLFPSIEEASRRFCSAGRRFTPNIALGREYDEIYKNFLAVSETILSRAGCGERGRI